MEHRAEAGHGGARADAAPASVPSTTAVRTRPRRRPTDLKRSEVPPTARRPRAAVSTWTGVATANNPYPVDPSDPLAREIVREAWLRSPRVLTARFADGAVHSIVARRHPVATGSIATSLEVTYQGDMVVVHAPTGHWEVLGDEFRMLAERGRLDDPKVSARIGAYCRRARLEAGLTQAEAAALTGIAAPNISRLERGKTPPRLLTLERLADAYGTTIAGMLRAEEPSEEAATAPG